jgi:hypothetical protein
MDTSAEAIVRPVEGVVFRRLQKGKGGVLLKLDSGAYHSLNETGAVLWELMARGRPLIDLASEFRTMIDTHPPGLAEEVREFFDQLNQRGLVDFEPPHDEAGPSGP